MSDSLPRTLPGSWYCNPSIYALEQRAIFQKAWYLLGPTCKFTTDEVVHYEFAGVRLNVSRQETKEGQDHRASQDHITVTRDDGLPLKTHTTSMGLLFTTITTEAPEFAEFFPDLEGTLDKVDFRSRPFRRSISYEGHFNWKAMVDGYQECLHCQYTHPGFSEIYPPTSYAVTNHHNWCRHIADPAKPDDGLFLYFFPNCTLNVYGGGMSLFRVCPTSDPGTTRMEFDYYHVESGEKFEEYFKFVRQVALEDYELCEKAQYNLDRGVYSEGILHPIKEAGVIYYQQRVRDMVLSQHYEDTHRPSNLTQMMTQRLLDESKPKVAATCAPLWGI